MTEYQELIIDWSETESFTEDLINKINKEENCLYQIYGNHHIYGRDILLYIGITKNIKGRFNTHLKGVFGYVNNLKVSIGTISNLPKDFRLEIPESILIANHKPAFNKEYIHNIDPKANYKIIVINNGANNMLQTCCTNFWWVHN